MFSGQSALMLELEANRALVHVKDWSDRNKLRFAPSKMNAMMLTKKKIDVLAIHVGNDKISLVDEIHLLGLTINKKLTFTAHVAKVYKKVANIYGGIARCHLRFVRLRTDGKQTWLTKNVGRSTASRRATSTPSLPHSPLHFFLILSRLLFFDIRLREATWLSEVKRGIPLRDICADQELERPVDFCILPHPAHIPLANSVCYYIREETGGGLSVCDQPGAEGLRRGAGRGGPRRAGGRSARATRPFAMRRT
ncbi:hypothetical protein EVAR_2840_1 [Eumeta japonica]|uniref:Uncharacterized protein n=1 Tax=Eumeta variegata TaxID=151549 RepID=A0A4C1T0M6_EUMVA|nr:hypothetical protein EVAR_2840_1 [Eumeta japonica]